MKIVIPRKYRSSTYKGVLITSIIIDKDFDGMAILHLMASSEEIYFTPMWVRYEDIDNPNADSLLCDIQDTKDLEVLK